MSCLSKITPCRCSRVDESKRRPCSMKTWVLVSNHTEISFAWCLQSPNIVQSPLLIKETKDYYNNALLTADVGFE